MASTCGDAMDNAADASDILTLYQWGPGFGLPSWDPASLAGQCFFRVMNLNVGVTYVCDAEMAPDGNIPFLRDGPNLLIAGRFLESHFRMKGEGLDTMLLPEQCAESMALSTLCYDVIGHCLSILWFGSNATFEEMQPCMVKPKYRWPLANIVASKYRERALLAARAALLSTGFSERGVLRRLVETLSCLSDRLGSSAFFFRGCDGEVTPTALDAVVYGYVRVMFMELESRQDIVRCFCRFS